MKNKQTKTIIILGLVIMISVAVFSSMYFWPRNLNIKVDEVQSISFLSKTTSEILTISLEDYEELINELNEVKFRMTLTDVKAVKDMCFYEIKYKDGSIVHISNVNYRRYNSNGKLIEDYFIIEYSDILADKVSESFYLLNQ